MKKQPSEGMRVLRYTLIGSLLMLVAVVGTGILGLTPRIQGFRAAMESYWGIWMPTSVQSPLTYISVTLLLFDIALFISTFIISLVKRKPALIIPSLGLFLAIAFLPFLFLLTIPLVEAGKLGRLAFYLLCAFTLFNLLAIVFFVIPMEPLFKAGIGVFKKAGGEDEEEQPQEQPAPRKEAVREVYKGLSEAQVRAIVEEYLEAHKEELHQNQEQPAPVVVEDPYIEEPEEPEEADDDEEEEFEEVEEVNELGQLVKVKRRKRVHFETRLRNSEFDLRHKYYDLRDYIKWYGLSNRISIPGDSFSLKRKKYAFITIKGKHIKFYASIDPARYEDSPIPVERATAKKFVDTPCLLKVKSDLSYRRAKSIIDDVMKENGIAKPEGEEPKETQHPEEK